MTSLLAATRRTALTALAAVLVILTGCASNKKADTKGVAFWPPYPDQPRLQFLMSVDASNDVAPKKSSLDQLVYGKEPEEVLVVQKPYGVKMFNGRVYVCDIQNHCVTVLDLRNRKTLILGRTGGETLQRPVDIVISEDGHKYVADMDKGRIYVFDAADRQVGYFGDGELRPAGLALFKHELYVADFKTQQVQVLDRRNGNRIRTVGAPGMEAGQFVRPLGLAVDTEGNLYVADVMKCQIQKFDPAGKLLSHFGTISANAGGMVRPKQIAVDKEGIIYVVDSAFQNVQLMDQAGRPLTFFGSAGGHPGAMNLPVGITVHEGDLDLFQQYVHPAFEPTRLVLVTNQFGNSKIGVYAFGALKPGKTVADIAASKGIVSESGETSRIGPSTLPSAPPADIPDEAPAAPATQPGGQMAGNAPSPSPKP